MEAICICLKDTKTPSWSKPHGWCQLTSYDAKKSGRLPSPGVCKIYLFGKNKATSRLQIKRSVTVLCQAQYSVDKYSKGGDSPWFHGRLSAPVPCPPCLLRKLALRATLWPYPTSAPPWKPHPRSRRTLSRLCFSGFQSLLLLPRHAVIQLWASFKITIACCWCVKKTLKHISKRAH